MKINSLYVIGSLRNKEIPVVGNKLREIGIDAFDDWYGAGPEADDFWKEYSQARGYSYVEAVYAYAATHVHAFDKFHLDRCDGAVLVLPAGRSGHLELGYSIGSGKPGFILLPDGNDRWDVMYKFATRIFSSQEEMISFFKEQGIEN